MAPPPTGDSAVSPCFYSCPAFLHRHFQPQPPPSHPLDLFLHSQQQPLTWDCSTILKFQLQAAAPSRKSTSLSGVCMAAARTVWFSFHLSCHRTAISLSALNVSPLTQTIAPMWGSDPCFSPPPAKGGSGPTNTPVFPQFLCPLEFCVGPYILFHWSGTPVSFQLVFCMNFRVWRCILDVAVERDGSLRPPTPLPSYSHQFIFDQQLKWLFFHVCICAKSLQLSDFLWLYGL